MYANKRGIIGKVLCAPLAEKVWLDWKRW